MKGVCQIGRALSSFRRLALKRNRADGASTLPACAHVVGLLPLLYVVPPPAGEEGFATATDGLRVHYESVGKRTHSGHSPFVEEPLRFLTVVTDSLREVIAPAD